MSACLIALGTACSGETASKPDGAALGTILTSSQPAIAQWANIVASDIEQQLQKDGKIDLVVALEQATDSGSNVARAICESASNSRFFSSSDDSQAATGEIEVFIDRQLMAAIGRYPRQLHDLKIEWPPSWLIEPGRGPDYNQTIDRVATGYLSGFLRGEFIDSDGFLVLPNPSDDQFQNLLAWMDQDNNSLAEQASFLAGGVEDAVGDCITRLSE